MSKDELFKLYKKVQQKDRAAERQLVEEHRKHWPNGAYRGIDTPGSCAEYRDNLHGMYLHLTTKAKK